MKPEELIEQMAKWRFRKNNPIKIEALKRQTRVIAWPVNWEEAGKEKEIYLIQAREEYNSVLVPARLGWQEEAKLEFPELSDWANANATRYFRMVFVPLTKQGETK